MEREDKMEIKEEEAAIEVMVPSRFRRICVFCGSSQGKKKSYQDAAVELGKELVHIFFLLNYIDTCIIFQL